MKVKAIGQGDKKWAGYYNNRRVRPGEVFEISDLKTKKDQKFPDAFSEIWMEAVDEKEKVNKPESKEQAPKPQAPSQIINKQTPDNSSDGDKKPTGSQAVI